jgi:hypothetical protein
MEKIMHKRLLSFFNNKQHGFCKGKTTKTMYFIIFCYTYLIMYIILYLISNMASFYSM